MKEIIYNQYNIDENELTDIVKRSKLVVENSKGELLFVKTIDNMFLIGGHVENNESDLITLIREIKEEAGIDFVPNISDPFICIKYLCKDYPDTGINTGYITNYYCINSDDLIPNISNLNLTEDEEKSGFKLVYIAKDKCIEELNNTMKIAKRVNVVRDTLDVIRQYLEK